LTTTAISIDFPERHSRLTTLFRALLAIPLYIFGYVYELLALICVLLTWFVMVITARYPGGLYKFVSGYLRFYGRFSAYLLLAVDKYPPFSGREVADYPVQVTIPERKPKFSRLKAFFRLIYILPAYILVAVLGMVLVVVEILAWIIILITGRMPAFIADYIQFTLGWTIKFLGLYLLLVENYS
jgi:hypothetical protein